MPRYLLRSRIEVALDPGETADYAHDLTVAGQGVAPSDVIPDRASPIVALAADAEAVTFANPTGDPQVAAFYALYVWSGQADAGALDPNLWQGAAAGGGLPGPPGPTGPTGPTGPDRGVLGARGRRDGHRDPVHRHAVGAAPITPGCS